MKKITFLISGILLSLCAMAQDTIVGWTFPTGTGSDSVADVYASINSTRTIRAEGGASVIDYSTNGDPTFCAQATNWDGGTGTKFWSIKFKTTGYENLSLTSSSRAGGANSGPRDWKVQYKITSGGTWTDLDSFVCANDWTTGVVNLLLPDTLDDQSNSVYIRWLVNSDTAVNGSLLQPTGVAKIDNIIITGTLISTGIESNVQHAQTRIYPNPAKESFTLETASPSTEVIMYDLFGNTIIRFIAAETTTRISTEDLPAGIYFVKLINESGSYCEKLVVK